MSISQKIIVRLIDIYQMIPGFWHNMCRYEPTCSNYMKEAVILHGTRRGLILGFKRILRCRPHGGYGYDPVPLVIDKKSEKSRGKSDDENIK